MAGLKKVQTFYVDQKCEPKKFTVLPLAIQEASTPITYYLLTKSPDPSSMSKQEPGKLSNPKP